MSKKAIEVQNDNDMTSKLINYRWSVAIITVLLICLIGFCVVDKLVNGIKLYDFISITSAILSIVLSVFAILYSYNSMIESSRQWAEINKCVSNIREINSSIESGNKQIVSTIFDIKGQISSIEARQVQSSENNSSSTTSLLKSVQSNNKEASYTDDIFEKF